MSSNEPAGRQPYSDEDWDAAPDGSTHVVDMQSGEEWIEPPAPPVSIDEFLAPTYHERTHQ